MEDAGTVLFRCELSFFRIMTANRISVLSQEEEVQRMAVACKCIKAICKLIFFLWGMVGRHNHTQSTSIFQESVRDVGEASNSLCL